MVKVKFLEKENKISKYLIENTDHITLNTIRRTISYYLPTYAVDEIDFYENNSVMIDEMLANRIGLSPVKTPVVTTGKKVTFNLEVEGPKTVYTSELVSNDSEIKMVYDSIALTKLNEHETIKLTAYATLGQGKDHVKYMPAIVSYAQLHELEISRGCEECKAVFEKASKNAIKSESSKNIIINPDDYDYCVGQAENCEKKCLKINPINSYILSVETIGQMTTKEVFILTERYLKEYVSILKKKLK
ncbi:MAG: DNA-directed RNA polymerase subunit D [Candidatus ainarchaeum sp.]|nr:DNA-directed RNA polymerase subunit D [Candidatus ainarchaeum sp.]